MNSRRVLSVSLAALIVAGIAFASVPFLNSFRLPVGAGEKFPRVDLSELGSGTYVWAHSIYQQSGIPDILVLQDFDNQIRVFRMPIMDGKYMMPDLRWDRWGGACESFGPDGVEGRLAQDGVIRCHDPGLYEYQEAEWRWTYSGTKIGRWTADLLQLEVFREGDFLRLDE